MQLGNIKHVEARLHACLAYYRVRNFVPDTSSREIFDCPISNITEFLDSNHIQYQSFNISILAFYKKLNICNNNINITNNNSPFIPISLASSPQSPTLERQKPSCDNNYIKHLEVEHKDVLMGHIEHEYCIVFKYNNSLQIIKIGRKKCIKNEETIYSILSNCFGVLTPLDFKSYFPCRSGCVEEIKANFFSKYECIILPFVNNIDISSTTELFYFIECLAKVLVGIHSIGIVHCDLKRSNIRFDPPSFYLIDFGVAVWLSDPNGKTNKFEQIPAYLPKEMLEGKIAPAVDIYAFGILILSEWRNLHKKNLAEETPSFAMMNIINSMLDEDPLKRPSADRFLSAFQAIRLI
jgi:hypothetical protein